MNLSVRVSKWRLIVMPVLSVMLALTTSTKTLAFEVKRAPEAKRVSVFGNRPNAILSFHVHIRRAVDAVVNVRLEDDDRNLVGVGSGVVISADGYVVTNHHVIEHQKNIFIRFGDGKKKYRARVIGVDEPNDIAVLKVGKQNLKPILFADSDNIELTDIVFAIGNPLGVGTTVSQGIVSAKNRRSLGLYEYENLIQTDASINPGNSGGALVNSQGELIGINSAILSRSGGNEGIGFAIPSNVTAIVAKAIIEKGRFERGYFGASFEEQDDGSVLIDEIDRKAAAYRAGIRRGDVIVSINGTTVDEVGDVIYELGLTPPGGKIVVRLKRAGKIHTKTVILGRRPSE